MKKSTSAIIIVSSIFILLGIVIIILAFSLGAKFSDYKLNDFNQTYDENISKLNINVDAGEIIIKEGDSFKIEANNIDENRFKSEITDNSWEVEYLQFKSFFNNFLFNKFSHNSKIVIYIPSEVMMEKFTIELGAGKGDVEKLNTKYIEANIGAGSLVIDNLYSEKSNITCGAGEININGEMIGYNKIDNGVGSIELNLIGAEKNYNYKYDIGIGEVKINNVTYSNKSDGNYLNNNANNDFDIDCGVGSIKIDIKE